MAGAKTYTPRWKRLALALALVLPAALPGVWGCGGDEDGTDGPPLRRVVLLSCDTLSAKHLQAYGYGIPTTVTFDSLATHGVLFRQCLAPQGWTLSSHMSMFTGLAPGAHRVGQHTALGDSVPTLAEVLRRNGFVTGGFFHSNLWLNKMYGFGRGFDIYQFADYKVVTDFRLPDGDWIMNWVDQNVALSSVDGRAAPFFLFLHFMDVHSRPPDHPAPYWPPSREHRREFGLPDVPPGPFHRTEPNFRNPAEDHDQWDMAGYDPELLRAGYDAGIKAWDRFRLRRLLTRLDASGYLDDTLVIVTADHGEEIAEHGGYLHDSPYGEVREVPLLILWPGRLPEGLVVDQPVSLMDLLPTILDLAGIPAPEPCQGMSLRPLLEDPGADLPDRDFLMDGIWHGYQLERGAFVAQAEGNWWSLVALQDTTGTTGTFEPARVDSVLGLYDLVRDPGETRDLRLENPRIVSLLRQRFEAKLAEEARLARTLAEKSRSEEIVITPEARRRLKALGY